MLRDQVISNHLVRISTRSKAPAQHPLVKHQHRRQAHRTCLNTIFAEHPLVIPHTNQHHMSNLTDRQRRPPPSIESIACQLAPRRALDLYPVTRKIQLHGALATLNQLLLRQQPHKQWPRWKELGWNVHSLRQSESWMIAA